MNPLQIRLASLRRRLHLVITFRGLAVTLALLCFAVAGFGLLDWRWHLPSLVRAFLLVGTVSTAGVLFYRYLLCPLQKRTDDLSLALEVEERFPTFRDNLASAVQFLENPEDAALGSEELKQIVIRRAYRQAVGHDFFSVIDTRGVKPAALCVAAGGFLVFALALSHPDLAKIGFLRLASPFSSYDWPRQTQLQLTFSSRIARGEAYEVRGEIRGVIPEQAILALVPSDGPPSYLTYEIARKEGSDRGTLLARLESGRVARNFKFQVRANDASSKWNDVDVLPPPQLTSLGGRPTPQIHLTPPAYTDLPSHQIPDGVSSLEAPAGTQVVLKAAADRKLKRAWLEFPTEMMPAVDVAAALSPLTTPSLAQAAGMAIARQRLHQRIPAELGEDGHAFTVSFKASLGGTFVLHFEDELGIGNSRLVELHTQTDPAPLVQLERPSRTHDSLLVLPGAELTIKLVAEDTIYAIRSAYLEYRLAQPVSAAAENDPRQNAVQGRVPLYDFVATANGKPGEGKQTRLERTRRWSLKDLQLKPGDVLILQGCATDFDDITVQKQPGRSSEVEIHIVDKNTLELSLNEAQAQLQQELVRARKQQQDALQKVLPAETFARNNQGRIDNKQMDELLQAEQLQQQIRARVGTSDEGLRAEAERILQALTDNQLPRSGTRDRMEAVAGELERLSRENLPQIEPKLIEARKQSEAAAQRNAEEPPKPSPKQSQPKQDQGKSKQAPSDRANAQKGESRNKSDANAGQNKNSPSSEKGAPQNSQSPNSDSKNSPQTKGAPSPANKGSQQQAPANKGNQQAGQSQNNSDSKPNQGQENQAQQPQQSPNQPLTDARKNQEEVEKTLGELLKLMEPWSSTREVKGEAQSILQGQRELQRQTERMSRDLLGKDTKDLTPEQKAELEKAAEMQNKFAERTGQLLDKMDRLAEERKAQDPDTARALKEAADKGKSNQATGKMQEAEQALRGNELSRSARAQDQAGRAMEDVVRSLEDRREEELDRLVKKMKEAEQKLDELLDKQELLKKKAQEAAKISDPQKREEALKRLAREQEELQKQTQDMVRELTRMRADRASAAMAQASQRMRQAGNQMQQGQNSDEKQDEALDRLADALDQLENAREQVEEELARERLAQLSEQIKGLRDRQLALSEEAGRIHQRVLERREWPRDLRLSMTNLSDTQRDLGAEVERLAKDKLDGAKVFGHLLKKAGEAMTKASESMTERLEKAVEMADQGDDKLNVPTEEAAASRTKNWQVAAVRRIDQLLEAMKPDANGVPRLQARQQQQQQQGGGQPPGGQQGEKQEENIDPPDPAQLKALKALQVEVNSRTGDFAKAHPDAGKMTPGEQDELRAILQEQQEISELFHDLTGKYVEKKP